VFAQATLPIPNLPRAADSVCPDSNPLAIHTCGLEHAKTFTPPRTTDGKPDFSGAWGGSQAAHENLEAHPKLPDDGGGPSVIIDPADGKVPIQPWAEVKRLENKARYIDQNAQCFQSGVPRHLYMGSYQFLQTPSNIVLLSEETNAVRIIKLDGSPHVGKDILLWQGDSRGHFEGETLVVETTNQNGMPRLDQVGHFYTDAAVVTERFAMVDMNAMRGDGAFAQNPEFAKPVYDSRAAFLEAVVFVRFVFGDVHVKAASVRQDVAACLECLVRKRQACMQAKRSRNLGFGILDLGFNESNIFFNPGFCFLRPVAVGNFVAQAGAQSRLRHGAGNDIE